MVALASSSHEKDHRGVGRSGEAREVGGGARRPRNQGKHKQLNSNITRQKVCFPGGLGTH